MNKGTCKHLGSKPGGDLTCAEGHDIRKLVGGEYHGWMRRVPCHDPESRTRTGLPMLDPVSCDDYCEPTDEEVAEYEANIKRIMDSFARGLCGKCGAALTVRGNTHSCDACNEVSGIVCGGGDLSDV
jgi:hypothetical protein